MKTLFCLSLAALIATTLPADEPDTEPGEDPVVTDQLKSVNDPTILIRRIWLDTEWNEYNDDSRDIEFRLAGLWSWQVSENQDWAMRLEVPFKTHEAGEAPGDDNEKGLGDIDLAAGTAWRCSETLRAGFGLEMRFPAATDDVLGDDVYRLQEFGTVAWDVTSWLTLSPTAEYNQSVARHSGGSAQHFLELYLPATFILPRHWAVTPRYEGKVDFENDNEYVHSLKLVVAKDLDEIPLGFAFSVKRTFDSGEKEVQVNFVTTYYFR